MLLALPLSLLLLFIMFVLFFVLYFFLLAIIYIINTRKKNNDDNNIILILLSPHTTCLRGGELDNSHVDTKLSSTVSYRQPSLLGSKTFMKAYDLK